MNSSLEIDNEPLEKDHQSKTFKQNIRSFWERIKSDKKLLYSGVAMILCILVATSVFAFNQLSETQTETQEVSVDSESPAPSDSPLPTPTSDSETTTPTPRPKQSSTPTPIPQTTTTPTATPRTANPPQMRISFPTNGQQVESESGTLCVVDTPNGGNTQGLQRRQKINSSNWTEYQGGTTLCYQPPNGTNTIELQYKNNQGDVSQIYSITFTFIKRERVTISLTGRAYEDKNCNANKDADEGFLALTMQGHIFNEDYQTIREFNTSTGGSYTHSEEISYDQTIKRIISMVAPSGYKSNPNYNSPLFTFSNSNRSATVDIPKVPNANVGSCL